MVQSVLYNKISRNTSDTLASTKVLDSPPCRGADPWYAIMMCCMRHKQPVSALWGWMTEGDGVVWGVRVASKGRWLAGAQQWEMMPLATVPQGNEESRGGRRGEGEKKSEKERKKGNVIFHGDCPKSLPVLYIATHIQKVAHTHKHTSERHSFRSLNFCNSGCPSPELILMFKHTNTDEMNAYTHTHTNGDVVCYLNVRARKITHTHTFYALIQ